MWGRSKAESKGKCSPCCQGKDDDSPPAPVVKKGLYSGGCIKPAPGTMPSSKAGFLVSFLVDARGGAMTGHRHWGMRVIIPPAAVHQPTRIQCRYTQLSSVPYPPPFMEREALASRIIDMSPAGESFKSPVLIEIPHFASSAGAERETIVLRCDDGETWYEHVSDKVENGEIYQDVVTSVVMKDDDLERIYDVLEVSTGRVIRILTSVFPKYFAIITRVREEVRSVGPDGGKVVLPEDPRLRATFPKNALYKKIKVGLQVQTVKADLIQSAFGRSVQVSKMITVEPRKRKFHQPIFVSIPLPCSPSKINENTNIRLLCSVTGATDKAVWQDMTDSTPLEVCKDVVHFSTKVSAIFWILVIHEKQRDPESALTLANRLYEESILVPYLARFSVFYRENFPKAWMNTIRVYCMTDDKAEKVIRHLQGFRPLAISGDVEITDGSSLAVRVSGNVLQYKQDPFTGEFLSVSTIRSNEIKEPFTFRAFEDNNMTLFVQPKDPNTPMDGCLSFWRKLDNISATQQVPLCDLQFDVSSGDVNFVIKDQSTWTPEYYPMIEDTVVTNGHNKNGYNDKKIIVEEEDPYEKIEIRRDLDETTHVTAPQDIKVESKQVNETVTSEEVVKVKVNNENSKKNEKTLDTLQETAVIKNSNDKKMSNEISQRENKEKKKPKPKEKKKKKALEPEPKFTLEEATEVEVVVANATNENLTEPDHIENIQEVKIQTKERFTPIKPMTSECVHNVSLSSFCEVCDYNQRCLDYVSPPSDENLSPSNNEKPIAPPRRSMEKERPLPKTSADQTDQKIGKEEKNENQPETAELNVETKAVESEGLYVNGKEDIEASIKESMSTPVTKDIEPIFQTEILVENEKKDEIQLPEKDDVKEIASMPSCHNCVHNVPLIEDCSECSQNISVSITSHHYATVNKKDKTPVKSLLPTKEENIAPQDEIQEVTNHEAKHLSKPEEIVMMGDDTKSEDIDKSSQMKTKTQNDKKSHKAKKKTKEFQGSELEQLRNNFAKQQQGVQGVLVETFKPLNTEESIKEDVPLKTEAETHQRKIEEENMYEPVGAEREVFLQSQQQNGHHLDAPEVPERRKNSSKLSINKETEEIKEQTSGKKASFIKEWQKDLKEFFSLGKKKATNKVNGNHEESSIEVEVSEEILEPPTIENSEDIINDDPAVENIQPEKRKKRKEQRKISESNDKNPFIAENDKIPQETEVETQPQTSPKVSQKPKVVVPSPTGIPKPLPLAKSRSARDSFISEDDDATLTANIKSVEDTEEFKKAVESFDNMFGGKAGSQTPEVKRLSRCEASPNLNWKRIKTSKSFELEETHIEETIIKEETHFEETNFIEEIEEIRDFKEEILEEPVITEEKTKHKNKKSKKNRKSREGVEDQSDEEIKIKEKDRRKSKRKSKKNSDTAEDNLTQESKAQFVENNKTEESQTLRESFIEYISDDFDAEPQRISVIGQYLESPQDEIVEKHCFHVKEGKWIEETVIETRVESRIEAQDDDV